MTTPLLRKVCRNISSQKDCSCLPKSEKFHHANSFSSVPLCPPPTACLPSSPTTHPIPGGILHLPRRGCQARSRGGRRRSSSQVHGRPRPSAPSPSRHSTSRPAPPPLAPSRPSQGAGRPWWVVLEWGWGGKWRGGGKWQGRGGPGEGGNSRRGRARWPESQFPRTATAERPLPPAGNQPRSRCAASARAWDVETLRRAAGPGRGRARRGSGALLPAGCSGLWGAPVGAARPCGLAVSARSVSFVLNFL